MPAPLTAEQKRERVEAKRQPRRQRASFNGTEAKLGIGHGIEGYHLHIINDTPGRLDQALATGYDFVSAEEVGGVTTNVVSRNSDTDNSRVRYIVGVLEGGQPLYAYLMKIPEDFYQEDQKALADYNAKTDEAIRGGNFSPSGGSTEGRYIPNKGIKITTE